MIIELEPTPMTPDVMQDLEQRGLIIRLCPGHHSVPVGPNEANSADIYVADPQYGPHKLIVATINSFDLEHTFGDHPDREEFLFIGDPHAKPFCLVVARCRRDELEAKARAGTLSPQDFVALLARFNDPEVSFFTMLARVPHGEVSFDGPGTPASFYVTESRDIETEPLNLGPYRLQVRLGPKMA